MEDLEIVFTRLEKAGLKLRAKKCNFCKKELLYLGFVLTKDGVHTNPKLASAVTECPPPTNEKGVRRFLGLTGYYRRFVEKYTHIASPMQRLLREDVEFQWDEDCQAAFTTLKEALVTAPVLAYPNFTKKFKLEVDASGAGLGAVLSQEGDDNKDHVISYWSRAIPRRKGLYISTELECMYSVKHYRPYLWGKRFEIVTDHNSLKWLMNLKNPTAKLQKWSLDLAEFDFTITHRAGRLHNNADALSRPPVIRICQMGLRVVGGLTAEGLQRMQQRDYQIGPYYDYVAHQRLPVNRRHALEVIVKTKDMFLDEGVLFNRLEVRTPRVAPTICKQLVVPAALRRGVMEECHDCAAGGALGGE